MKLTGKKLLALGLVTAMTLSAVCVPEQTTQVQAAATAVRAGEEGCQEIPGTISSFDEYNTSFLSVSGFASDGVNDRSADLGTSKHRQVSTPAQFIDAIQAAKRGTYLDEDGNQVTPVSQGSVTVIEVMNDLDMGTVVGASLLSSGANTVQQIQGLNSGYTVTHGKNFPGVTAIDLSDIDGLTIFSNNGSAIKHCTINIGSGGTNMIGSNDVVIRNLKFDGCWQWDNTGSQKEGGWAYMKIYMSSNIWIDHCSFTIAIDGNVDVESGTNGLTLSWCKFGMTKEEALAEDSVVRSSVEYMESKYQSAEKNAKKKFEGGLAEVISNYEAACKQVRDAGYNPEDEKSLTRLKSENNALYKTFDSAKTSYTKLYAEHKDVLINKGKIYTDMRLGGATPEQIMEYAAYHSKVHLTGSGDREFKDMDTEDVITINDDGTYTLDNSQEGNPDSNERLEITLAYDCYNNVGQRVPMIRMGVGHMYNCYMDNSLHETTLQYDGIKGNGNERLARGMNARDGASIAADTCVYKCFNQPMIGTELQGSDIQNINPIWDSLYATAINWMVIVNSKVTNSKGETYMGSSWDKEGNNLFTGNGYGFKYTDLTLKKFCWDSKITGIGDTPISEISRNVLSLATFAGGDTAHANPMFTWHKGRTSDPELVGTANYCGCGKDDMALKTPSWLKLLKDKDGNNILNSRGNAMFEPFDWEYNYESGLPYEYQMVKLEDVETVIPQNSGAGAIEMKDSGDWTRIAYEKGEDILAGGEADVSPSPEASEVPSASPEASEAPSASPEASEVPSASPEASEVPSASPEASKVPSESPEASKVPSASPEASKVPSESPVVSQAPSESPEPSRSMGDVDRNGKVELADAQLTLKAALKITSLDEVQKQAADTDKNGKVELADAQKILKVALKIESFDEPQAKTAGIQGYIRDVLKTSVSEVF